MKGIIRFNASLTLSGLLMISSVFGLGARQMSAVYAITKSASSKTSSKTAHKTHKVAHKPTHVAHKTVAHKPKSTVEELPSIATKTPEGDDVDPAVLVKAYGKQANTYYALAQKKEKQGRLDQAQKLYFKSLAIRQRIWGDTDPAAAQIIYKVADIHLKRGRWDDADTCFKRELAILSKRYGPGSYDLVPTLNKLGQIALKQKKYSDAYDDYKRVLAMEVKKNGAEGASTVAARLNLIDATVGEHDWKEAEKLLKLSEQISLGKNDDHSKSYLRICDNYATVLTGLNRPGEADNYANKAASLRSELGSSQSKAAAPQTTSEPKVSEQSAPAPTASEISQPAPQPVQTQPAPVPVTNPTAAAPAAPAPVSTAASPAGDQTNKK